MSQASAVFHLIRNAQLYCPEPAGIGHVLVAGERMVYVGKDAPEIGASLLVSDIDAAGAPLMPGIIDIHAHLTGGGGEAGFATQVPPVPLSDFVRAGITSVIGLLGTDDITRSTDSLVARVRGLREEGLSAWCYTGGYHWPATTLTGSVTRDIVSIDCIVALGELAISDHRSSQMTQAELARAAGEAHVAGLMTGKAGVCHLHLGDADAGLTMVRRALADTDIPARVFNPTHCNRKVALFDEACELANHGCFIDLTAFPVAEGEDGLEADIGLTQFLDRGGDPGRITISSDSGGCLATFDAQGVATGLDYGRAQTLATTLARCIAAVGIERALPAFTRNPATLMRLHSKGRINVGCDADLVLLGSDNEIHSVMARGEWMVSDSAVKKFGTFESTEQQ
ncbi:MAG: beta-aspartyl-peptidase [Pseudomonadota bacterium]